MVLPQVAIPYFAYTWSLINLVCLLVSNAVGIACGELGIPNVCRPAINVSHWSRGMQVLLVVLCLTSPALQKQFEFTPGVTPGAAGPVGQTFLQFFVWRNSKQVQSAPHICFSSFSLQFPKLGTISTSSAVGSPDSEIAETMRGRIAWVEFMGAPVGSGREKMHISIRTQVWFVALNFKKPSLQKHRDRLPHASMQFWIATKSAHVQSIPQMSSFSLALQPTNFLL